jgi:hypothetical protein
MRESGFSVDAQVDNPPGHAHRRFGCFERYRIRRPVFLEEFRRRSRPIEFVRICFVPERLDFGKFFLALKKLVDRFKR